jgi:hypothetical protein
VQILSHRGQWLHSDERNSREAFTRSFRHGFGTETDVRDMVGHAVISHDPPTGHVQTMEEFLELHGRIGPSLTLALNVKSDGLQDLIAEAIRRHKVRDYFLFDMSIPDMLGYLKRGLRCFTRQSDIEPDPALYEECEGVWIDTMRNEWLLRDYVLKPISDGKRAAIVSPELHGRPHLPFWEKLAAWGICGEERLLLCTDYPEEAKAFFSAHAIPPRHI